MIEPTGYTALDLIGFTDRGAYDPDAYYVKNDIATVGNTKWRCLIDDTHNVTPTEGANWTIYLESATSLAGMSDVTLTSPKNGDGLVHDGNDWKNIPIMTKEQWKKNGAYNLLPNNGTTQVSYGLTFTFNPTGYKKGVVHVTGTKSDSGSHGITLSGVFNLKAGTYKILDGLSNNNLGIALIDNSTSTFILQTYNQHDATFTLAADTEVRCTIVFLGAQNTTFDDYIYPMITTDLNATPADYVPHAKTNRELTEDVAIEDISSGVSYASGVTGTDVTFDVRRIGKLVIFTFMISTGSLMPTASWGATQILTGLPKSSSADRARISGATLTNKIPFAVVVNASGLCTIVKLQGGASTDTLPPYFGGVITYIEQ